MIGNFLNGGYQESRENKGSVAKLFGGQNKIRTRITICEDAAGENPSNRCIRVLSIKFKSPEYFFVSFYLAGVNIILRNSIGP